MGGCSVAVFTIILTNGALVMINPTRPIKASKTHHPPCGHRASSCLGPHYSPSLDDAGHPGQVEREAHLRLRRPCLYISDWVVVGWKNFELCRQVVGE